jgi:hypothetical protein
VRAQTGDTRGVAKPREERSAADLLAALPPLTIPDGDEQDGEAVTTRDVRQVPADLPGSLRKEVLDLHREPSRFVWSVATLDSDARIVLADAGSLCGWAPHRRLVVGVTDSGIILTTSTSYLDRLSSNVGYLRIAPWETLPLDARVRLTLPPELRRHLGVAPSQPVIVGTLADDRGGMVWLPAPSIIDFPSGDERLGMSPTAVTKVVRTK